MLTRAQVVDDEFRRLSRLLMSIFTKIVERGFHPHSRTPPPPPACLQRFAMANKCCSFPAHERLTA